MGLGESVDYATQKRQHTPKLAFFAKPAPYVASSGKAIAAGDMDIVARILSMGKLHHAMTGTGAVGIAAAAAVPGTVVSKVLGGAREGMTFGHPSGTLAVGAEARQDENGWVVTKVVMSRSARRLMEGVVLIPPQ
jgi:2-methylaconitate cis-trans-isomerase PrpF